MPVTSATSSSGCAISTEKILFCLTIGHLMFITGGGIVILITSDVSGTGQIISRGGSGGSGNASSDS